MAKNGKPVTVFVYNIKATDKELASAKAAEQQNIVVQPDGSALLFSVNYAGEHATLIQSPKTGKFNVDNSELDKIRNIVDSNPGALGNAVAAIFAQTLMTAPRASSSTSSAGATVGAGTTGDGGSIDGK